MVEYNKNPYDLESDITVKELYEKMTDDYFEKVQDSYIRIIKSAWSYCSSIYNMRAKDVAPRHIKGVMEDAILYQIEERIKVKSQYATAGVKTNKIIVQSNV